MENHIVLARGDHIVYYIAVKRKNTKRKGSIKKRHANYLTPALMGTPT